MANAQMDIRDHLHGMWSSVAAAWGEHADEVDERGAAINACMFDAAGVRPGARVLELACGPGGAGLEAADIVGRDGLVVLSDVAAEMTEIAVERARARGLINIDARVIDLEEIGEPDASYDAVICREGLMFALDPGTALAGALSVLVPGGRAAFAVWGPRARNPWLGLVLDAASAQLGMPMPPPGIPGPFALDDAQQLEQLMRDAGFVDVAVAEVDATLETDSFDSWWERTSVLAGPLAKVIAAMPPEASSALRDRARELTRPYSTAQGLVMPGVSLVAHGRRPS